LFIIMIGVEKFVGRYACAWIVGAVVEVPLLSVLVQACILIF
jgi:hypothetical protein